VGGAVVRRRLWAGVFGCDLRSGGDDGAAAGGGGPAGCDGAGVAGAVRFDFFVLRVQRQARLCGGPPLRVYVAQRFACKVSGAAEAEIDGRLAHLEKLRTSPGKIDICDDITSGLMGGYCAEVQARFRQRDREARFTTG
jgi:hypothetical protein